MNHFRQKIALWTLLPMLLVGGVLQAQETAARMNSGEVLNVPIYKSRLVALSGPVSRVSVGNPDVADILVLRANQLYVLGKDLGTTNVFLWDRDDFLVDTVEVEVTHDLQSLKKKLYELMPNEEIKVHSAQRNIILSGNVSNAANMEAALRIARGYFAQMEAVDTTEFDQGSGSKESAGEVINLMSVGGVQQVMLEVKVAEIARTELRRLDVRFNTFLNGNENWNTGRPRGGRVPAERSPYRRQGILRELPDA
ncbi:MAG: pilus assembly protein N-terminal domain-containing protein [Gammaproteobacteria bacterium]